MGILFSFISLLSWGIGDFLIQKSARKFGDWIALFYITAFATIVLLPFVYKDLVPLLFNYRGLILLSIVAAVITFAAYFDFEALRIGKISIIEPIYAFELPVTTLLAIAIIKENLSLWQIATILLVLTGIFLVSTKSFGHFKKWRWEKGVFYAIVATLAMGGANFLYGVGARETNPLLVNWFASFIITVVSLGFIIALSKTKLIWPDLKNNSRLIVSVSFLDGLAWVTYSYAMLYIPIAVATGISESYIALASILGLSLNREKLARHQKIGLILTVAAAITLASITKD